jgi:hypothetical protein
VEEVAAVPEAVQVITATAIGIRCIGSRVIGVKLKNIS